MTVPLTSYPDFLASTGPGFFTGPKQLINESQRRTYILKRLLDGEMSARVQGGSKIVDRIVLEGSSSYRSIHPDESLTWDDPQVIDNWEVPFRFSVNHYKVTGPELANNIGSGGGVNGLFQQYKDLQRAKEQNCFIETINGMEDELCAAPSYSDMEAQNGKQPYSLPALISEHAAANLDFGVGTPLAAELPGADPVWAAAGSTLQAVDFTAHNRRWHNHKTTYNKYGLLSAVTPGTDVHLFTAFSQMYRKTAFQSLPQYAGYAERANQPGAVFTSDKGQEIFEFALQANQDHYALAKMDPAYDFPMYRRVDVINIESLGTNALYTDLDGGGGANFVPEDQLSTLTTPNTSAASGIGFNGPRFYFVNGQYLKKTFKAGKYFQRLKMKEPTDKVETMIFPFINYHNNHLRSRFRMGIISPFANVS